jgi:tetratricopeptide (TPR) repeat protein
MSKSTVIDRKDMKEPDRFQEVATQAASWMVSRKKQVAVAGAIAVAALALVAVVAIVQERRDDTAGEALGALLEAAGAEISSVPDGSPGPSFATEEAKQRAVIAEADGLLARFGSARPAQLAALVKGDAHYELREWDQAAQAYDRFLKDAPADDPLRFGALEGAALVAEAKGDLAGAAQAYERMAKEAPRYADRADLARARVLATAGKVAEAREILAAFSGRHKESILTPQASQELTRLGAE